MEHGLGSFYMPEQFALDGPFGYGAAVDRDQASTLFHMFAQTVVVYDTAEHIFAYTTFSCDEYAEVGGCHLDGFVERKE